MSALSGKVALVTGAGRGIGAAIARRLAADGARLVLTSRSEAELLEVAASIRAAGGEPPLIVPADIGQAEAIDRLFARILELWGPVDILVCNAAVLGKGPVDAITPERFDRVMAVNVRGVYRCCQLAFEHMQGRGGSIITVSSLGGVRSTEKFPGLSVYVTSKAAVVGMTEALAVEGRPLGVRVNCVAPGAVETRMLAEAAPGLKSSTTPEDVANLVAFLADGDQSRSLNGAVLEVNSNA